MKLFTFDPNTNQNKFIPTVNNAKVTKYLIYDFYKKGINYPDNRYLLEMFFVLAKFKCRDFFFLDNNAIKL